MSERHIENVLEASLLAAGRALKLDELMKPFLAENVTPERSELRERVGCPASQQRARVQGDVGA